VIKESLGKKVEKSFIESDLIFTGKVIGKEIKTTEIYVAELDKKQTYVRAVFTFEIIDKISGKFNVEKIEIVTSDGEESCGFEFQIGKKYLVFSRIYDQRIAFSPYLNQEKVKPFYSTDLCMRTNLVTRVKKREIKKLKRLAKQNQK
jgi:hypothetical protein